MRKIAQVLGSKRLTADIIMSKEVAKRLNRRFSFDFLIPRDAEYRDMLFGIGARVIALGEPSSISLSQIGDFARYFRANPADVVHTHVSLSARVGARLVGIDRCISTRSASSEAHSARKWVAPIYNRFTTATLCHSPCIFDELLDEGIARDRIIAYFPPLQTGNVVDSRGNSQIPELICPLPLYDGFGQSTLIRAVARLPKEPRVRLLLCGRGPELREYRLLAKRLGVGERVEFSPDIMSTIVYNNAMRILVFPHEGRWEMPHTPFLDWRLPVIASDIPQNREIFGETCIYFSSGDAFSLGRVIEAACCEKEKSQRAVTDTACLSLEALCNFYDRLYSSI